MRIERIVVGVDGSPHAERAMVWAAGLAELTGAEVVAVHAVGLLEPDSEGEPVPAFPIREEIHQTLEEVWTAPLAGVRSRSELRDGTSVSVLLEVADEVDADLIVVGSRGMGGYPHLLLGSTSTQVAQHSTRPVVIVPAPDQET